MRRPPWCAITIAAAGCVVASIGAGAAEPDDAHWSQVVTAAKREGRVTFYSASVGTQEHVAIARSFETRYGIPVDILEARASEIRERNRVEASSGRRIADVMWNGSTSTGIEEAAGNRGEAEIAVKDVNLTTVKIGGIKKIRRAVVSDDRRAKRGSDR